MSARRKRPTLESCPHCNGTGQRIAPYPSGAALREERLAAGLSMRALAAGIGLSPTMLCDIENGRRRISQRHWDAYLAMCRSRKGKRT